LIDNLSTGARKPVNLPRRTEMPAWRRMKTLWAQTLSKAQEAPVAGFSNPLGLSTRQTSVHEWVSPEKSGFVQVRFCRRAGCLNFDKTPFCWNLD